MSSISSIAQSGLQASSQQLAVSANNVANALTDGFQPSRVEPSEAPGGGVESKVVKQNDPDFESRIDRNIVALSRTDLGQEMVTQMVAANAFQANLSSLQTANDMISSLLNTLR